MELTRRGGNTRKFQTCRDLQIERLPFTDWPRVKQHWETLLLQFSAASIFLSTAWTETWIEIYGEQLRPEILVFRDGNTIVGMCLLVSRTVYIGPFPVRVLYINAAGEDEADETCIEKNDILALSEYEEAVCTALGKYLLAYRWDELRCQGFRTGVALGALEQALLGIQRIDSVRPSRYADLRAIRDSGKNYFDTLGATTRSHIRQYSKKYKVSGDIEVRVAGDLGEALMMLSELENLHQRHWSSRGMPGSFSSEKFRLFHITLIKNIFHLGFIQILKVEAGENIIGYLYNFVDERKVYYYQSGFNYLDKKMSPGLVTLAFSVKYCMDLGLDEFDFLAGDYQQKRALASNHRDIIWTVFRRTNWKMRVLDYIREARRKWRAPRRKET